jgi:hypothetical protein
VKRLFTTFAVAIALSSCAAVKTQLKKDLVAAVECAKVDPANTAIVAAAKTCILDVADGKENECLKEFAPLATWSTDEIACIAAKTSASTTTTAIVVTVDGGTNG